MPPAAQGHQLPVIVRELLAAHNTKALDKSSDHLRYRQSPTATARCLSAPIRARFRVARPQHEWYRDTDKSQRTVSDKLWRQVKARQLQMRGDNEKIRAGLENGNKPGRRSTKFWSGPLYCGVCGRNYIKFPPFRKIYPDFFLRSATTNIQKTQSVPFATITSSQC